jgi:SynChlorMet cassette radical SAM/SPASM protein ScmE
MDKKPLKSPESITIAITGRCNLSCAYCFYADEMAALKDLPTQSWLDLFSEAKDAGVMKITLSGGEIFTRKDIFELIEGIVKNKMRFNILTNGTLITNSVAQALSRMRQRCGFIQVSLDGSKPETHDAIRGKGSFEKMVKGIDNLKKHNLPWTVRVTANKLNVRDLEAILDLLYEKLELRNFGVNEAFPRGAGQCNHSTLEMSKEDRRYAFRVMQDFDKAHPGVAAGTASGPLVIANMIKQIDKARQGGESDFPYQTGHLTGCNIMWKDLSILHDGTYVPCHQLPQIKLGTMGKDSLLNVWRCSSGLVELRKRHETALSSIPHCQKCNYIKYCTGGCPGVAYAITGDVNTINPRDCYRAYIGEDPVYDY